jgi:hypothetical protein
MSRRKVTPADGTAAVTVTWDNSQVTVPAGTLLEVEAGGNLEWEIGAGNPTELAGAQLVADQTGSGKAATRTRRSGRWR